MDRKAFTQLGQGAIPPAFGVDIAAGTVNSRLDAAAAIAKQLRCRYELTPSERSGEGDPLSAGFMQIKGRLVHPLGDDVLRASSDEVLVLLADRLVKVENLERRLGEKGWKDSPAGPGLRTLYGYADWERSGSPRVAVRIAVCLAADATFAPYAAGLLRAMSVYEASIRTDVLSVGATIWAWAHDYRALAFALSASRRAPWGVTVGFPAFTRLLRRVLGEQLDTGLGPDVSAEIAEAAEGLSTIATRGIGEVHLIGSTVDGSIQQPMLASLGETQPHWLPDELEDDAEEAFARGAAPLVLEALTGQRSSEEVAVSLESLASALRAAKEGVPDA